MRSPFTYSVRRISRGREETPVLFGPVRVQACPRGARWSGWRPAAARQARRRRRRRPRPPPVGARQRLCARRSCRPRVEGHRGRRRCRRTRRTSSSRTGCRPGMDVDLAARCSTARPENQPSVDVPNDRPGRRASWTLGCQSFTDTKAREAQFIFVDYFTAGHAYGLSTSGNTITSLSSIHSLKVAVECGARPEWTRRRRACVAAQQASSPALAVFPTRTARTTGTGVGAGRCWLRRLAGRRVTRRDVGAASSSS